jgi:hypothetical protein
VLLDAYLDLPTAHAKVDDGQKELRFLRLMKICMRNWKMKNTVKY